MGCEQKSSGFNSKLLPVLEVSTWYQLTVGVKNSEIACWDHIIYNPFIHLNDRECTYTVRQPCWSILENIKHKKLSAKIMTDIRGARGHPFKFIDRNL